jgi:hypothetical protein
MNPYQLAILFALQAKPMYLGTVDYAEKSRRRVKNKMQKASRKANR